MNNEQNGDGIKNEEQRIGNGNEDGIKNGQGREESRDKSRVE